MDYNVITKTRFAELLDAEFARPLAVQSHRRPQNFDPSRCVTRASYKQNFEYTPHVHVMLRRGQGGYSLSIT